MPWKDPEKNKTYLREYGKKWRPAHPGFRSRSNWKRRGIDPDEAERVRNLARNCAICGANLEGSLKHVDHDHSTGRIRGVLCKDCNQALGMLHEDERVICNAITYLLGRGAVQSDDDRKG
jgi:hypothetical protein